MFCKVVCWFAVLSVVGGLSGVAQSDAGGGPEPRLHGEIGAAGRVRLVGSIATRAASARDAGAVADDTPVEGITLVFQRSAAQEAELEALLAAQQDVTSPQFHQWLTPEGFGQQFGMADADLQATEQWLEGQGFRVDGVSVARDRVTFSGTAGQVAAAFGTALHRYEVGGQLAMAPEAELSLPEELAPVVSAVLHLEELRPTPKLRANMQPRYTASTGAHYLVPQDLAVMYDVPGESSSSLPGLGQTIAVVGQSYVNTNEAALQLLWSGGSRTLTPVLVPGTGSEAISVGDAIESEVDIEYAGGLASWANILLVYVGSNPTYSVFDSLAYAVDRDVAPVITVSYGLCEAAMSTMWLTQGNALLEQAASQGQTVIAASGDNGSLGCASVPISDGITTAQQQELAVDYPADSPYVVAVGGTQMVAGTFSSSSSNWNPGQALSPLAASLLQYVPETAWNEDSAANGILAGGGGASTVMARPAWQTNLPGIPAGATRLLPDVALQASTANPGFLFCSGYTSTSCEQNISGGTSFAAPTFAAMVALLNQSTESLGQGNVNPVLYQLAGGAQGASIFHDVSTGTIACTAGVPGCSAAGQSGFAAGVGYDEATGLGSVDFGKLLAAWPGTSTTRAPTRVTLSSAPVAGPAGSTETIGITVTPGTGSGGSTTSVSGGVGVSVDGSLVVANLPFTTFSSGSHAGLVSYELTVPAATGSHVVTVTYAGDATHGPSSATTAVLVGNVQATGNFTLSAGNVSLPANGSTTDTVTVTPAGGYAGRLTWSMSLTGQQSLSACYLVTSPAVQGVTSATLTLGAGTACSSATGQSRTTVQARASGPGGLPGQRGPWQPVSLGVGLCCAMRWRRRRRRWSSLAGCVVLAGAMASVLTVSGCGGGGSSSQGTPAPADTATLTATDSVNKSIQASTTFLINVQ